jgi:hypothetical protein
VTQEVALARAAQQAVALARRSLVLKTRVSHDDCAARLATAVVGAGYPRRGSALRDIQYLQPEYADTEIGTRIVGIAGRARQRLKDILDTARSAQSR